MPSTPYEGYALIDCNNFFVSCERVFKPYLNHKPVAVLSVNDGCFIARSKEVKALGIPMGAPLFQYKDLVEKHRIVTFSSNFKLYGDFSDRIMNLIGEFCPDLEIYSIDEAFVPITIQTKEDFKALRKKIYKCTSIPVSIGMAPTKTLAKLANTIAKKKAWDVCSLLDLENRDEVLQRISIGDVWGIGRRSAKKLNAYRIYTAYDFIQTKEHWVQKKMGLLGLKTQLELKGIPCSAIEREDPIKKSLVYSKSFSSSITTLELLKEAVAHYASKAAEKIRRKGYKARLLSLYLKQKERSFYETTLLNHSSNSSLIYIDAAVHLLQKLYKKGPYLKAGIHLGNLSSDKQPQLSLFDQEDPRHDRLMNAVDTINHKYGQGSVFITAEGFSKPWTYKRESMSPKYTTQWTDIPIVKI